MDSETRNIPATALMSTGIALVLRDKRDGAKTAPIKFVARAGKPIQHWYFGKVVHDFDGMVHKDKIPIDYVHSDTEIIGYVNKFNHSSGDLELAGRLVPYSDSDRASEIIFKNRAGIPYEASIDFRDSMVIEELRAGQMATVNGYDVEGPATIIRQWTLRGVAVCPYGADPNTSSQLSNAETIAVSVKKPKQLNDESPVEGAAPVATTGDVTPDTPAGTPASEAAQQANHEGQRYVAAFGTQGAVWFVEGKPFDECVALYAKSQADRIAQLEGEKSDLEARLAAATQSSGEATPVDFQTGETNEKTRKGFASKLRIVSQLSTPN